MRKMGALPLGNSIAPCFITSSQENPLIFSPLSKSNGVYAPILVRESSKWSKISSKLSGSEVGKGVSGKNKMEEYNVAMKRMMRNPYEYHHDLGCGLQFIWIVVICNANSVFLASGMNYTLITENLIVGSQPQKVEDIDHLREEQNVAYILNLQQDTDVEYWGIDLPSIVQRCKEIGIHHMRSPAKDFDPDSLRSGLPKSVSLLEWAISEEKGRVYVHCTAGLGRAPAVAIAYMFWFCDMDLTTAYETLTSKRPCGPNKRAIRGATYDLAKNDPWKEPFENLPDNAFEGIADWERALIQDRVRALRHS
nr:phosphoglucan phosphatase LSF2, chloroplastic [Ipomoea batatas]